MTYLNPPDLGGLSRPTGIPTREKMRRKNLSILRLAALFFVLIVFQSSCDTTEPPKNGSQEDQWKKIPELDGMDVKGFKIIDDDLYVYGWGTNNGLYKTSDGLSWTKISLPDTGNFEYGVSAITMKDIDLIGKGNPMLK